MKRFGLTLATLALALPALAATTRISGSTNGVLTDPYAGWSTAPMTASLIVNENGTHTWSFLSDDGVEQFNNTFAALPKGPEFNSLGTEGHVSGRVTRASDPGGNYRAYVQVVKGSNWAAGYPDYLLIRVKTFPGGVLVYSREGWCGSYSGGWTADGSFTLNP